MKNLAKHEPTSEDIEFVDSTVAEELETCGLWLRNSYTVPRSEGEVPCSWVAEIVLPSGPVKFTRAWGYWRISGKIPLPLAVSMYAKDGNGIRADGHCGNIHPSECVSHFLPDGRQIFTFDELKEFDKCHAFRELWDGFARERAVFFAIPEGCAYVTDYHIDTQEGLNLFVKTLNDFKAGK